MFRVDGFRRIGYNVKVKIAVTGHRSEKIAGLEKYVGTFLGYQFGFHQPDAVIVGMAAGVDLIAGGIALDLNIPVVAARPWAGHKPRKDDVALHDHILANAAEIVNVNDAEKYPGPWVYSRRNEWMVDHAQLLLAVWDGSTGGTANCYNYALAQDLGIVTFNPQTREQVQREPIVPF